MYIKKNEDNSWEIRFYYKDHSGSRKQKHKKGFPTKKAAQKWAEEFLAKQEQRLDMTFSSFYEVYEGDMRKRLRENTFKTKSYIIELKILPFFGKKKMVDITVADVRNWQAELIKEGYAPTYLNTINNQLRAIFNYAVRYYGLDKNPCTIAGSIGKGNADEMQIWSVEEFEAFVICLKDKPVSYYAFLTMFWTGIRLGELLALTLEDYDPKDMVISINKSYQRISGREVVTEPKTAKSKRKVPIPEFLVEELNEYISVLYGITGTDRLFNITKSYMEKELARGCKLSNVKKIRIHDIRHSHASLLISKLQMPPNLVAERLGHERVQTTLQTYSHMYPSQGRELADQLDKLMDEKYNGKSEEED